MLKGIFTDKLPTSGLSHEGRCQMRKLLKKQDIDSTSKSVTTQRSTQPHLNSSLLPLLIQLTGRIHYELETSLTRLLALNPSRREMIVDHLDHLSETYYSSQSPVDSRLRQWIAGTKNQTQNKALKTYLEEVAILSLGQALVLKSWADRKMRKWSFSDLGRLNWALSSTLKPHIPMDREGWHITRPNLYSWYNPASEIQDSIWKVLENYDFSKEQPDFFHQLIISLKKLGAEHNEASGYDSRFYHAVWQNIESFGFTPDPESILRQQKIVFSPTLRDGDLLRSGPSSLNWIGLESSPFHLMTAELVHLWIAPYKPPFWSIGTGLEVHASDQLQFQLGTPSQPSVLSRITEMEACDLAFILEESSVSAQSKTYSAKMLKKKCESIPHLKRFCSPGTTLGDLQACVALSKLRPGGFLAWARDEPLSLKDGQTFLNLLLDKLKLLVEWDFSELSHSLPSSLPHPKPLYPKYFYLFKKEIDIESRLSHHPIKLSVHGQLRSHIEVNLILEDSFQASQKTIQPRGQWTFHHFKSPLSQRDWIERWPEPISQSVVQELERLKSNSLPLAHIATVRPNQEAAISLDESWPSTQTDVRGLWISAELDSDENQRKLAVQSASSRHKTKPKSQLGGPIFFVAIPDEKWLPAISLYLSSSHINQWLECHAERKKNRWILNEQVIKSIPIPKALVTALESPTFPSEEWKLLSEETLYKPRVVKESLEELSKKAVDQIRILQIHSLFFIKTSSFLHPLKMGEKRFLEIITSDGKIRWRELISALPRHECTTLSLHPRVRISGALPPHLPIDQITRVKTPLPGILFSTKSGFSLHLSIDHPSLLSMVWDQLDGITHPTWHELLQYLRLPRNIELAETTASEVLIAHEKQRLQIQELEELLACCKLF